MRRMSLIVIAGFAVPVVATAFIVSSGLWKDRQDAQDIDHIIDPIPRHGVITYSEGDTDQRTLSMRKILNGKLQDPCVITPKGKGGDIMGVISFDGRWLAFARNVAPADPEATIQGQWKGFENEDYHKFHAWDIHVVRIDGDLPAESIKVGHGYWPSWGEDSGNEVKTLYFGNFEEGAVYAATIHDEGNRVSEPYFHAQVPDWTAEDHHMQVAPDGQKVAIRINGEMYIKGINGNTEDQIMRKGCHPSWMVDSKWLFIAASKFWHVESGRRSGAQGGKYHFGSSSNMKWAMSITDFDGNRQNCGFNLCLYPMGLVKGRMTLYRDLARQISSKGSWPDVHEFAEPPIH